MNALVAASATVSLTRDTLNFLDEHPGIARDWAWKLFLTTPGGVSLYAMKFSGKSGERFYNNFRRKFMKLGEDAEYRASEKRKLVESSANLSQSIVEYNRTMKEVEEEKKKKR